ncbi:MULTISPECIES: TfoX/Sxy family protein [Flavobacterium]|uniref:TfoX/Sxy family protein n=1 Tax=Flavobacterium jumunjinense TaxID=998845 RepID=A0ABV5GNV6_9FLAO|nr:MULTISPECIES: TfoX/Sxy family protein [Flavobacterium]
MFGGIAFILEDKMCFGVIINQIILRVLDIHYEIVLETNHYNPMNFTGKTMKGFLFVDEETFQNNVFLHKVI